MPSVYYDQGRRDAENGEFNQLFYHTYHDYKRGYDEGTRGPARRKVAPALLGAALVLAVGSGLGWLARDRGVLTADVPPVVLIVTATPVTPTPTFPFVIATAAATATPTAITGLAVGVPVVVATGGDALRVRSRPTTAGDRLGSLPNTSAATIIGGPQEADGHTWWEVQAGPARGWVVADFLKPGP